MVRHAPRRRPAGAWSPRSPRAARWPPRASAAARRRRRVEVLGVGLPARGSAGRPRRRGTRRRRPRGSWRAPRRCRARCGVDVSASLASSSRQRQAERLGRGRVVAQLAGPSAAGRWRRSGTRRRPARARSGTRPAWPRRPRGCASRGRAARGRTSAGSSGRRGGAQAEPPNADSQLFGSSAPDVPVGVLAEPRVLDRRVARHDVHQHAQPARVRLRDEPSNSSRSPKTGSTSV